MDILILLLIIILPLIAQGKVNSNYSKYLQIENSMHLKGCDAAKRILEMNGITNVKVHITNGRLSDHYNPRTKTINLSQEVYNGTSIASVAIAAHEVGHAIQDNKDYAFLRFRNSLVPVVNFTARFATIFIILGFASELTGLFYIGILILLLGLFFQLVTLPVEFNASNRAKEQLKACGLVANKDVNGTNKMLKAAAYTYVASFLAMALQILRLILIKRRD